MRIKLYPMIKQSIASMMLLLLMLLGVVNALAQTPPICTTAIAGINMCTNPPAKKSSCSSCTGEDITLLLTLWYTGTAFLQETLKMFYTFGSAKNKANILPAYEKF